MNLLASNKKKQKGESKRVKEESQASISHSSTDVKMDLIMKSIERLIDRLSIDNRGQTANREHNEPHIKNPNFRQPRQPTSPPPQILQREQRNTNDQVMPPFHQNHHW